MTEIYIECGTTLNATVNTGIQRVVRNVVRESDFVGHELGIKCIQVAFVGDKFYEVSELKKPQSNSNRTSPLVLLLRGLTWLNSSGLFHFLIFARIKKLFSPYVRSLVRRHNNFVHGDAIETGQNKEELIEVKSQKILLLLDSTWDNRIWSAVDEFRAAGGHVCAVLYDLIPFSHPETVAEETRLAHTQWWTEAPLHLDSIMCISSSVRDDYFVWQEKMGLARKLKSENVGYFHLGAELKQNDPVIEVFTSSLPSFLVVGSLEPRKNHSFILDAFDQLWEQGKEVNLVIVGGFGWKSEKLLNRIQGHPELGRKLFLIRDASDRDLNRLYNKCDALIIASLAEGFGLPIVEAFHHGTPVICSDIPVFREVAGSRASYFDLANPLALVACVLENLEVQRGHLMGGKQDAATWLSWRDSTEQLISRLVALACASSKIMRRNNQVSHPIS